MDFPGEMDDEKAAGEVATEARGVPAGAMKHDGFGDHYTQRGTAVNASMIV
jgi:hypothetical protein